MKRLFAILMALSFLTTASLAMAQGTAASLTPASASSTPTKKMGHKKVKKHAKKKSTKKMNKSTEATPTASGTK